MIIPIGDKYRIASDIHCWQVEHYKGKRPSGEERWEPVTYHIDFDSALTSLFDLKVRLIDSSDTSEILKSIQDIRTELMASVGVFRLAV